MPRNTLALAAAVAAAAITLTACSISSSSTASVPSSFGPSAARSAAVAIVTSTPGQQVRSDFNACIKQGHPAAQIQLFHQLTTDTKAHPNGAWQAWFACLGVTQANQGPFKADVLGLMEKDHVLTSPAGRKQFIATDLPNLVAKYADAAASAASPPSAS